MEGRATKGLLARLRRILGVAVPGPRARAGDGGPRGAGAGPVERTPPLRILSELVFRDWGLKALAFVAAVFLFVFTRDEVTRGFTVPLKAVEDPERVLLTELPETIQVQVRGPWTRINRLQDYDFGTATLDLTQARPGPLEVDEAAIVMPSGVVLAGIQYDHVDLRFDPVIERDVEVEPRLVGSPAPDYELVRADARPARVRVRGGESFVRRVLVLATESVDVSGADHDVALVLGSGWGQTGDLIGETLETIENTDVPGFGAAAEAAIAGLGDYQALGAHRDRMEARLKAAAPGLLVHGAMAPRVAGVSCFGVEGLPSETQIMGLDLAGFAVSAGSACSSGKVKPSRVLTAMGLSDTAAKSSIRASFGWASKAEEFDALAGAWIKMAARARPQLVKLDANV